MKHRLVFFCSLITLTACRSGGDAPMTPPTAHVRCAAVEKREWSDLRTLRGLVAAPPDRDAIVSAQVAGRLVRVHVREGDTVQRGAVLAEIEPEPLRDALKQAEALLTQARAQREMAALTAAREQHLFERGINARQTFEAARAALGQTEGSVALATSQVDIARRNVERATVRASMTGVVVRLVRREGEVVDGTAATPVLELADPSTLELAATVGASDLLDLHAQQTARVTFDAAPGKSVSARVLRVSPAIDAATGMGTVRLSLDPGALSIPLGLLGTAEVAVSASRDVVVVPAAAIRNAGGTRLELVRCKDGKARPVEVLTGARRDGWVEVVSGLAEKDLPARVVVDGLTGLEDGIDLEEAP